jgi:DNA-binding MurR/RpiR family transcriptional regulator
MENILYIINEKYDSFSKMHKKLADYVLENSDKAILMPISELADESGVSEATIVRFTYRLGYTGYREFQRALLDSIKYTLTTLQRLDVSRELGENELIHSQVNSDVHDINTTFTNMDPTIIMNAAKEIDRSKKVFILGLRTSNILTQYLAHYLRMMTFDVILVEGTFMEPYEYLVNMTSEDILICISLPRYSQRTIQSVKLIHNKGYRIISLTDSESSPIFNYSSISLIARCSMNSFFDSMVSPLVIINTLLLSISATTSRDVEKSFKELEEFWEKSSTYERI